VHKWWGDLAMNYHPILGRVAQRGGVLPMGGYTGRLCPKGVPHLSGRILKGREKLSF